MGVSYLVSKENASQKLLNNHPEGDDEFCQRMLLRFLEQKKKSTGETSKYFAVKLFIKEAAAKMNYVAALIFFLLEQRKKVSSHYP